MAWRYLFARRSHSAVSVIAVVSVCGVALATMAIVCVLSVFNGFRNAVDVRDSRITPDLLVTPASAPVINSADSLCASIAALPGVACAAPVVTDNAVAYRGGYQLPVKLMGVSPEEYKRITGIERMIMPGGRFLTSSIEMDSVSSAYWDEEITASGEFSEDALFSPEGVEETMPDLEEPVAVPQGVLAIGTASQLGFSATLSPTELSSEGVVLFMPRRTATTLNEHNPAASFMVDSLEVVGVAESGQNDFDNNTILVDLDLARALLEYDTQASSIYVMADSVSPVSAAALASHLGNNYVVRDRLQQHSLHLRMISIEKWITFLLLSFILLIASFNVISTISMLIVDKRRDLVTLSRLGAPRSMISEIFCWESAYVCAAGSLTGALLGVALCLIQQYFGIIKISGDASRLILTTYPVEVRVTDLLLVLVPSVGIAIVTACVSSRFARRQIESSSL